MSSRCVSCTDGIHGFTGNFGCDGLNRFTSVSGLTPKTYQYAPNGNLTYKSDVGTYTYPTNGVLLLSVWAGGEACAMNSV